MIDSRVFAEDEEAEPTCARGFGGLSIGQDYSASSATDWVFTKSNATVSVLAFLM